VLDWAKPGTGPVGRQLGYDWPHALSLLLRSEDPDVVLAEFVGNYYDEPFGDGWHRRFTRGIVRLTDEMLDAGVRVVWAVPPRAARGCDFEGPSGRAYARLARWVRDRLPRLRPVTIVDWRGDGTYDARLRETDCLHWNDTGRDFAAVVAARSLRSLS
jgi:hypothetical protein